MAKKKKNGEAVDVHAVRRCVECNRDVQIGTGGEANWQAHLASKGHKMNANAVKSSTLLTSFFKPRSRDPGPLSTSDQAHLVHGHASPPLSHTDELSNSMAIDEREIHLVNDPHTASPSPSIRPPNNPNSMDSEVSSPCMLALHLIDRIRSVASTLPSTIGFGDYGERFSRFEGDPSLELDEGQDAWELVNKALHGAIGYALTPEQLAEDIRRGPRGIDGFCDWLEIAVRELGIKGDVLEDRLERVIASLKICGAIESVTVNDSPIVPPRSLAPAYASPLFAIAQSPSPVSLPVTSEITRSLSPPLPQCRGYKLEVPAGQSPYVSYPVGMHERITMPWSCRFEDDVLYLISKKCSQIVYPSFRGDIPDVCTQCRALHNNDLVMGIRQRMYNGVHENSNYDFFSHSQLAELARRQHGEIKSLRLKGVAASRQILSKSRVIDDMNRFKMAVARGGPYRIHSVVRVSIRHGDGIRTILDKMEKAHARLFKPRDYAEEDFHLTMLLHCLGGARVAHLARKTHGLPSLSATKQRLNPHPLLPSAGYPTIKEMTHNLTLTFPSSDFSIHDREEPVTLFADELKVQERLRWDGITNKIIGVCREHGKRVSLDFVSIAEADALLAALKDSQSSEDQRVHLASEATVLAARILTSDPSRNGARPFIISGTCKREDVDGQYRLLSDALSAFNGYVRDNLDGRKRVYAIASDGDSWRRRAMARLTMIHSLPYTSPIFAKLSCLPLFDIRCGLDEIVSDFDMKHNFKRHRNTLIRKKGVSVQGSIITSSILKLHLSSLDIPTTQIDALLAPNDKQDVPLAFALLTSISQLPDASPQSQPSYIATRRVLQLLGKLYHHLLEPYTNVTLTLAEQLEHLSAAAHITLALYAQDKGDFIPVQLFYDSMTTIKCVYFSIAKLQATGEESAEFWIGLLGTDALEEGFGNIRTMIGNDTNADVLQVSSRFNTATLCSTLLSLHPEWKRGPRRLFLPSLSMTSNGEVNQKYDHISPHSWKGDVNVHHVVLQTCWLAGRRTAEAELQACGIEPPFETMETTKCSIFAPFGDGRTVLLDGLQFEERDEEAEEGESRTSDDTARLRDGCSNSASDDTLDLEPDLEDMINTALTLEKDRSPLHPKYDAWIPIDSSSSAHQNGPPKRIHKASILRMYSNPLTASTSKDRLRRVRGYSSYQDCLSGHIPQQGPSSSGSSESVLAIEDPVATLLRCNEQLFLAVGQVIELKSGFASVQLVPLDTLKEPSVRVRIQVMQLSTVQIPAGAEGGYEWEWTGRFETLPEVSLSNRESLRGQATYLFDTSTLRGIASLLRERLQNDLASIPNVPLTLTFPYRTVGGAACFVCEVDGESRGSINDIYRCHRCPTLAFDALDPKLIEHMAGHMLLDDDLRSANNVCGLCLNIGLCMIHLARGPGGTEVVDLAKSHCQNLFNIRLGVARSSTKHSPCTNAPLKCPLCDLILWKYNLRQHIVLVHVTANPVHYKELWMVDGEEAEEVKRRFSKSRRRKRRGKMQSPRVALAISEAHSSRVALRHEMNNVVMAEPSLSPKPLQAPDTNPGNSPTPETPVPSRLPSPNSRPFQQIHDDEVDRELTAPLSGAEVRFNPTTPSQDQAINSNPLKRSRTLSDTSDCGKNETNPNPSMSYTAPPRLVLKLKLSKLPPTRTNDSDVASVGAGTSSNAALTDGDGDGDVLDEFCWCRGPESGNMVQCSARTCEKWFHFECVGLLDTPEGDWFCSDTCVRAERRAGKRRKH